MELSYQVVLIEGQPAWSGRAKHSYGHLLFLDIASGVHDVRILQIAHPEVIPHGIRCEGLLRVLSWVSFDLPTHLKGMVGELLQAAGRGNTELHTVAVQGRDIRDAQPSNEAELQAAIISMIPIPGGSQDAGGQLVRDLLVEFLKGFSLRTVTALWYKDRDLIWTDGKMFLSNKNIVGKPKIQRGCALWIYACFRMFQIFLNKTSTEKPAANVNNLLFKQKNRLLVMLF